MDAPGASQEALAVDVGEAIRGDGRKVQVLGRRPGPRARRAVDGRESHRRLVRAAVADVRGLAALDVIIWSGEILSNTLAIQGKLANEL